MTESCDEAFIKAPSLVGDTCQAHLPDFYNPPPLDADSVSRVLGSTERGSPSRCFAPSHCQAIL